ncbi:autoinducer binding domain-containing protein [Bradyrhizobium sp. ARR65]|uniref:autoinducer binding domain-containing protein n=1 Tax=Bradyrhizobium sp. ARR65 TaxID=1040989 RepID=UPI0004679B3C|nr:autoinducer binding domain-containing protein [Bradyrhizobium sp. ARR65]
MSPFESIFEEFIDAIQTAVNVDEFERIATRLTQRLGLQRFAYLRIAGDTPMLISSYPKSWTSRYFQLRYQQLDPVLLRARVERALFGWGGEMSSPVGNREQRRFFDEATTFGIRSGITVPIRGGFGQMAAFSLATDARDVHPERLLRECRDLLHAAGVHFHCNATIRLGVSKDKLAEGELTQRERQCLAWVAHGKTVADIAVLVQIAPRTVVFHLENARRKLGAASIAQCIAEALRRGLLP